MKFGEVQLANDLDHKALKVLKILLSGRSVTLEGIEVYLVETKESYKLVTKFSDDTIIGLDYSLELFLKETNKVSNEEIDTKLGGLTIQDIK